MKRDLPPLPWLRAFEAAARHLSFTLAAKELNLTQAAVSKQIKLLEEHLREPLFVRKTRRIELTKSGEAYVPKLRDAFERMEAGTREVFGQRRTSTLTIRVNISFAVNWLAPRLGDFLKMHPSVPIRILNSTWPDSTSTSPVDLDIQYGRGQWHGFQANRLTQDHLSPVCDPKTASTLHTPTDLKNHRLIHVLGYEDGWAHWFKSAGLSGMHPAQELQVDSSLIAFALAARGTGVALARSGLTGDALSSGRLVRPFEHDAAANEAFYLLSPTGRPLHPNAAVFINWVRSIV
jgi:LysR family glycine cleavage system transcriptional activator